MLTGSSCKFMCTMLVRPNRTFVWGCIILLLGQYFIWCMFLGIANCYSVCYAHLSFYSLYLKNVVETVSFSFQTPVTFNQQAFHCTSRILVVDWRQALHPEWFLSCRLQCKDYCHTFHPLMCPTYKDRSGSDLANEKAHASLLTVWSPKTPCLQHIEYFYGVTFYTILVQKT